jgi:uncharacterized protein YciI
LTRLTLPGSVSRADLRPVELSERRPLPQERCRGRESDMTAEGMEAAYAPFVASLLAGGFIEPADGEWTAELVAAHVAQNNDLIAETAEQVAAGAQVSTEVSYDNANTVDAGQLAAFATTAGGLTGLAAEVERSAARLAAARQALGDREDVPVHVVIRHNGQIVQDGPMPIGAFVEGNASFHLDMHLAQLKALEPVRDPDEPPGEFDTYQLVLLELAPDAPVLDKEADAALLRQHLGHFRKMHAAGYLKVAGPIRSGGTIAGICLYQAGSVQRARKLAEDDPAVRGGQFVPRVMTWYTQHDAIRWAD